MLEVEASRLALLHLELLTLNARFREGHLSALHAMLHGTLVSGSLHPRLSRPRLAASSLLEYLDFKPPMAELRKLSPKRASPIRSKKK
jgi:hypothetical protein